MFCPPLLSGVRICVFAYHSLYYPQESSLWETQTLLHHYHPDVARLPEVLMTPALKKAEMVFLASTSCLGTYIAVYCGCFRALYHPTHAVRCDLLLAHACRMLTGACNLMVCPIPGVPLIGHASGCTV